MSSHSHAYMVGAICRVNAISSPALRNRLLVRCFTEWKFRTYKESHVHCVNALRKVPTDLRMRYFGALACRFGEKAPQRMLHAVMVASDSSDDEDTRHNRPLFDLATRFMSHPLNMCVNNAFTEKAAEEFALGELASEQLTSEQLGEKAVWTVLYVSRLFGLRCSAQSCRYFALCYVLMCSVRLKRLSAKHF